MTITATEFKTNFGKYLELADSEDIFITKNGKTIALLTDPQTKKFEILDGLVGVLNKEISIDEAKEERLKRQWDFYLTQTSY